MQTITTFLTADHRRCDDVFVEMEQCVSNGRWDEAQPRFQAFSDDIEHHFTMEETVLFPAFENATGSSAGPTSVMKSEHRQIRDILQVLRAALALHDSASFLGNSETLNIMIQQHNAKEESILYVMADRVLSGQQQELLAAMHELAGMV
jgi:hemerythrin-like domain-containing protein